MLAITIISYIYVSTLLVTPSLSRPPSKDYRTTDNVFIMQALIANARKVRKAKMILYGCIVDFKKAFDSVPRQRLWEVLASLGVKGDILACIQSIYKQDEACVLMRAGLMISRKLSAALLASSKAVLQALS